MRRRTLAALNRRPELDLASSIRAIAFYTFDQLSPFDARRLLASRNMARFLDAVARERCCCRVRSDLADSRSEIFRPAS